MWTLNKNMKETYLKFLKGLVEVASYSGQVFKDPIHRMMMAQYLQLQDRVTEAIKVF